MDYIFLLLQIVGLFVATTVIWVTQSAIVLGFCRRAIYPVLYRSALTTWLIAQPSIIFHELAHFFFAVASGSHIKVKESFITPTAGRIAAVHEESIFGWVSRVVAALAPSIGPPLIIAVLAFITAQRFEFDPSVLFYPASYAELRQSTAIAGALLFSNAQIFLNTITDLSKPLTYLLIYLAMIGTIAAGPSRGDWRTMAELLLSPVPALSLLVLFGIFTAGFAAFGYGLLVPFTTFVAFLLFVTIVGIAFAFTFTSFVNACHKIGVHALLLLFAFCITYAYLYVAWPLRDVEPIPLLMFIIALLPPIALYPAILILRAAPQRYG